MFVSTILTFGHLPKTFLELHEQNVVASFQRVGMDFEIPWRCWWTSIKSFFLLYTVCRVAFTIVTTEIQQEFRTDVCLKVMMSKHVDVSRHNIIKSFHCFQSFGPVCHNEPVTKLTSARWSCFTVYIDCIVVFVLVWELQFARGWCYWWGTCTV